MATKRQGLNVDRGVITVALGVELLDVLDQCARMVYATQCGRARVTRSSVIRRAIEELYGILYRDCDMQGNYLPH